MQTDLQPASVNDYLSSIVSATLGVISGFDLVAVYNASFILHPVTTLDILFS